MEGEGSGVSGQWNRRLFSARERPNNRVGDHATKNGTRDTKLIFA
jgi:hypothetical protein